MLKTVCTDTYFVGIDGGGTKCKAILESNEGSYLSCGLGGPANPFSNIETTKASIIESVNSAISSARHDYIPMENIVAGIALAGVNIPGIYNAMASWKHPFKQIHITTDLHAACLGAHNKEDGAVIIVGTGSCGYANVNNTVTTLGGYGFTLGDQGSGAWIGHKAVQATLLAYDKLGPETELTHFITRHFGNDPLQTIEKLNNAKPYDYAQLAPLVFEAVKQHDSVATDIIKQGCTYIETMANKLLDLNPPRLSIMGGIAPIIQQWLSKKVVETVSPPLASSENGAIYFARSKFNNKNGK